MQQFGATRDGFLASLAPLIAFPLVGGTLMLLGGGGLTAVSYVLVTLCALVAPLVLSFEVARLWHRQQLWLRFATAFNWCRLIIPFVGFVLLVIFAMLVALGLPNWAAQVGLLLGLLSYEIWLHWFLALHGLGLSRSRALLLAFAVNFASALLVVGHRLLTLDTTAS
jgi:hypothetical protein